MTSRRRARGALLGTTLLVVALLASPTGAPADVPELRWTDCGDGYQCATAKVPRDYGDKDGRRDRIELALTRLPAQDRANRIGSLFINFGGPGAPGAEILRAIGREVFGALNERFDLVSWDPRGTGGSAGRVDCMVNQETEGLYSQPFPRPLDPASEAAFVARIRSYIARCMALNDRRLLPYLATTNTVRDLDLLRGAVGDRRLSYLGFSYGTFIGAQYATLFPGRARALALDGAVDHESVVNRPIHDLLEQTAGFERALGRFLMTCAARQDVCRFGGEDPWSAFDELAEQLDAAPLPAPGAGGRLVDGDDVRAAAFLGMYAKQLWPVLAQALSEAAAGDVTGIRLLADAFYGRLEDGTYDPFSDQYVAIQALDARWPDDVDAYLEAGEHSYRQHDHFWINDYGNMAFGLWPVKPRGAYFGEVRNPSWAATALVIGTKYDPATPYKWAQALTADLRNARLLTMRGDGHTAYLNGSPCVDAAVEAYLEHRRLPSEGTVCRQQLPFEAPQLQQGAARKRAQLVVPHVRPLMAAR
jgi:pimeloyl-ACP methyl ester carboxylesterase